MLSGMVCIQRQSHLVALAGLSALCMLQRWICGRNFPLSCMHWCRKYNRSQPRPVDHRWLVSEKSGAHIFIDIYSKCSRAGTSSTRFKSTTVSTTSTQAQLLTTSTTVQSTSSPVNDSTTSSNRLLSLSSTTTSTSTQAQPLSTSTTVSLTTYPHAPSLIQPLQGWTVIESTFPPTTTSTTTTSSTISTTARSTSPTPPSHYRPKESDLY